MRIPAATGTGQAGRAGFAEEFRAGVRFFRGSPVLLTLTVGVVLATLGVGAIDSLAVFFVPANLYVTASWLGPLIAAFGAGAIAGALLTGPVARRVPFARNLARAGPVRHRPRRVLPQHAAAGCHRHPVPVR